MFLRTIAIQAAKDDHYRREVLLPEAASGAEAVKSAIHEHLSCQSLESDLATCAELPAPFCAAILAAFETATLLAADLDACGDDMQPTWYETGSIYDSTLMTTSVHSGLSANQCEMINMTLVPGIDVRPPDGEWTVLCRAVVHRS